MDAPLLIVFLACPVVLISLLYVTAPYGRHFARGWGPALPSRLAWILMELPAVVVIGWLVLDGPGAASWQTLALLALWQLHYLYRTFLFPLLMRPSGKTFPALLVLFAVVFNVLNGYNNGGALNGLAESNATRAGAHVYVGALMFLAGFSLHVHSDRVIRHLREPGQTVYRIPEGGLFRWISSPHYLGEIIQWTGWAILTWSLAGLSFALFTFCNLAPRAISNHRWYREKFPDYPAERKILIPGLF